MIFDQSFLQQNFIIIQDLDGVCIPLVKDPLTRILDKNYIMAAKKLGGHLFVLTNGEHGGARGVNSLVEKAILQNENPGKTGLYLPGLAAGGIEYQDCFGNLQYSGIKDTEHKFLNSVPGIMKFELNKRLISDFEEICKTDIDILVKKSILDNKLSPTINLNYLFEILGRDTDTKVRLQKTAESVMDVILFEASNIGLSDSFFLHKAPNLGEVNGIELTKISTDTEIGTTDIQLLVKGAIKEAGVLTILNKYIESLTGVSPLGSSFTARAAPKSIPKILELIKDKIPLDSMPIIIGVGDTVTSTKDNVTGLYQRGGSDRGFLTLIQEIGKLYNRDNKVLLVNSSGGEVNRPDVSKDNLTGVSDKNDLLQFNYVFSGGPKEYIDWFVHLADVY